ncbi:TPA: hypothetical protein DEB00_01960 [Candidatus Uhrbacteria bacterium]|nr:hypothetical protein [Candidatus Uhrbacteria bacterium]
MKHFFGTFTFIGAFVVLFLSLSHNVLAVTPQSLVKTPSASAVYYVDVQGERHAFPDEQVYFSWYRDFSDVQVISEAEMASLPLKRNIVYRPGTYWIKIQSLPKVYAVSQGGEIRWIESEQVAQQLTGTNQWQSRVRDVPDTFFLNYHVGDPITMGNVSEGYNGLMYSQENEPWMVWNGDKHALTAAAITANALRQELSVWTNAIRPTRATGQAITGRRADVMDAAQLQAPLQDIVPVFAIEEEPVVLISSLIPEGYGSFVFQDPLINPTVPMTVYTYRPAGLPQDAPILFVIHGASRAVEAYRSGWVPYAEQRGFVLLLPHFPADVYSSGYQYPFGNVYTSSRTLLPENYWYATMFDAIFDHVVATSNSTESLYDLFGFSGGGQLVHRALFAKPYAKIRRVMASSSGWYLWPDYNQAYPAGFGTTFFENDRLAQSFSMPLHIIVGSEDVDPEASNLSRSAAAMLQGTQRVERATNFFDAAQRFAAENGLPFAWTLQVIPGVAHSNSQMAPVAAQILYGD